MPKVITWNIRHGGGNRVDRIIDCLNRHDADIVVLTEFRNSPRGDRIRKTLESRGLVHQHAGCGSPISNTVLLAARNSFRPLSPTSALAGYEHCCVGATFTDIQILAFYFPQANAKAPLFEWLLNPGESFLHDPTLLIGDFNTGIHHIDEEQATFHHADKFVALQAKGWVDVWRSRNPDTREFLVQPAWERVSTRSRDRISGV